MPTSSSKPKKVNFKVKQGDTFRRVIIFENPDGTPLNVSTAVFKLIIEGQPDLTLGNGLTIYGTDNNRLLIQKDITWTGIRKCELERVMAGITRTHFEGKITSYVELNETDE